MRSEMLQKVVGEAGRIRKQEGNGRKIIARGGEIDKRKESVWQHEGT